jgi:hypothetical protein
MIMRSFGYNFAENYMTSREENDSDAIKAVTLIGGAFSQRRRKREL